MLKDVIVVAARFYTSAMPEWRADTLCSVHLSMFLFVRL